MARKKRAVVEPTVVDWRTLPEVHVSDVGAFLACRRAWGWSSGLKANLEPIRPYAPFQLGRAVHEAVERLSAFGSQPVDTVNEFFDKEAHVLVKAEPSYAVREAREAVGAIALAQQTTEAEWLADGAAITSASLLSDDLAMLEEQRELAIGMVDHYQRWEKRQSGSFALKNLEFLTVEQNFMVPIVHPVTGRINTHACFAGKWDGLVRQRDTGDVYIWELKTTKSISHRAKMLANDIQCSYYLNAARLAFPELAGNLKGMIYTLMAKRVAKPPRVLDTGFLSKDIRGQSLDSYIMYVDAHHRLRDTMTVEERQRFIADNYGTALAALLDSTKPDNIFFERHIAVRNEAALQRAALDLWHIAANMTNENIPLYPTPGYNCNWCQFYEPCIDLQNGNDVSTTLQAMYRKRVKHAGESDADTE